MSFLTEIEPLKQSALAELKAAADLALLEQTKGAWIGPNGKFTALMKQMGTLSKEERPAAGKLINAAKVELEAALVSRREELELKAAQPKEPTDFTLPGRRRALGRLHPLTQVTDDIVRAFRKIGFAVADGPEIEDEYHCFDALNTPADHPARDTQDTFYLEFKDEAPPLEIGNSKMLLRTHTSSVQIRVMEKQSPPVRIIVPGRVYRRDNADATHNPTFHQIEGLYVDRNVTVGDLKGTVEFVFREIMGSDVQIRFRPLFQLHRAELRDRFHQLARQEDGQGLAGDRRLRHGASASIRDRRLRPRSLDRLGVWVRHRTHRHAPLRHQRYPPLLRERRAVLETILIRHRCESVFICG